MNIFEVVLKKIFVRIECVVYIYVCSLILFYFIVVNYSFVIMFKVKKSEKREKEKEKDKKVSRKKKDEIKYIWRGNVMGDMMIGALGGRDGLDRGEI